MLEKFIHIDHSLSLSLQDQIKAAITHAIASGFVSKELPIISSRKLAECLKVSRNTILRVYEQLSEEGFLVSTERKGYYINPELVTYSAITPCTSMARLNWHNYLVSSCSPISTSPQREGKHYPYRFIHGMVDESVFPVAEWRKCSIQVSNKINSRYWTSANHQYAELVEQIRVRVLPRRGIFVNASEIIVTLGCQQSLSLISQLLTTDKTSVGIENPGYPEAYTQLSARGAKIHPIEVDGDGLVVDRSLAQCDLVYTTPSNQFPTTVRMPTQRRKQLIEAAEQHDFLIIEDDFEHEVNFIEQDVPALKGEFYSERVIYLSSFSSTIAPGLRIGFMVAAEPLIQLAKQLQRKNHSYPPQNNCQTLALFLGLGHYDALIQKLLKSLREKWLTMEKALNYYFPQSGVVPSLSGSAFWVNYSSEFDADKLALIAQQQGILINSGSQYYFNGQQRNGFRLSFNSIDAEHIREGILRLSKITKQLLPPIHIDNMKGEPLCGKEITRKLTQHTLVTSDCFNIPYYNTFLADGTMVGISERPNDKDEGRWWVEENKMCYQWNTWQFSEVRKLTLVLNGNQLFRFDDDGFCVSEGTLYAKPIRQ